MSQDYVLKKSAEALEATNGSKSEAGLLLRVWAETDKKLKDALMAPFIGNICALAIQRADSKANRVSGGQKRAPMQGEELLAAIGDRSAHTMTSSRPSTAPPPAQGSMRHRQAVAALASAYKER